MHIEFGHSFEIKTLVHNYCTFGIKITFCSYAYKMQYENKPNSIFNYFKKKRDFWVQL